MSAHFVDVPALEDVITEGVEATSAWAEGVCQYHLSVNNAGIGVSNKSHMFMCWYPPDNRPKLTGTSIAEADGSAVMRFTKLWVDQGAENNR